MIIIIHNKYISHFFGTIYNSILRDTVLCVRLVIQRLPAKCEFKPSQCTRRFCVLMSFRNRSKNDSQLGSIRLVQTKIVRVYFWVWLHIVFRQSQMTPKKSTSRAQFYTLIQLKFNPIYFMQHYTYFKQFYQESLKQNIKFT